MKEDGRDKPDRKRDGVTPRASDKGRSGRGLESIRPYLRAQIEYQWLMTEPFRPVKPEDGKPGK